MSERNLVAAGTGRLLQVMVLAAAGLAPIVPRATVPALISGVVLVACLYVADWRRPPLPTRLPSIGLAALMAWCGASALWAETPASLGSLGELAGLFVAGSLLIAWAGARNQERLNNGLVLGLEIALTIYAFELVSGDWITRWIHGFAWRDILDPNGIGIPVRAYLINGTAIMTLLLWPCVQMLLNRGRRLEALLLAAGTALASLLFGNAAALVALAAGAAAWAAHLWKGGRAARAMAVLFAVLMLGTPFVIHAVLKPLDLQSVAVRAEQAGLGNSTIVRLFIWRFATERIVERPLLGWGFDAARHIPGGGDKFSVYRPSPDGTQIDSTSETNLMVREFNLPLHPHNQVLQIWLELGLVGALLISVFGVLLLWRQSAVALAVAASAIVFDFLSFGAWQSWWIASVFIAAALTAATSPMDEGLSDRR